MENVGIRKDQKEQIKKLLRYGDSINGFVQKAVDDKLRQQKQKCRKDNKGESK